MNTIPQVQNNTIQLQRLAAQRGLYSEAKTILAVHMIAAVPVSVAMAFLAASLPAVRVYAASWGLLVTLLDVFLLSPLQVRIRSLAARIQELFDCDVLDLPWHDLKSGPKPGPESLHEHAERYRQVDSHFEKLRNWYPPVIGSVPPEFGRIICQRTNCWWDATLRRRYAHMVLGFLIMVVLIVAFVGLRGGFTVDEFVMSVVAPLVPAILLGIRLVKEQNETANGVDRLKDHAERLWKDALRGRLSSDELAAACRDLQDEIFDHRRRSTPVLDVAYRVLRDTHEEHMNVGAADLVREFENTYDK